MAQSFVKGTLHKTSIDENVSLSHVVANLQQIATLRWLFSGAKKFSSSFWQLSLPLAI